MNIYNYGFKGLEGFKDYLEDYVIETPEELRSALFNHFDMKVPIKDCIKLLELVK